MQFPFLYGSRWLANNLSLPRAKGYGFPGITVDGRDPLAVYREMKQAVDRARQGKGPTLIEAVTYRLAPHSSDDDDLTYRSKEEVEAAKKIDPVVLFRNYLIDHQLLDDEREAQMHQQIDEEVDEATEYAQNAPDPHQTDLYRHVYA